MSHSRATEWSWVYEKHLLSVLIQSNFCFSLCSVKFIGVAAKIPSKDYEFFFVLND